MNKKKLKLKYLAVYLKYFVHYVFLHFFIMQLNKSSAYLRLCWRVSHKISDIRKELKFLF